MLWLFTGSGRATAVPVDASPTAAGMQQPGDTVMQEHMVAYTNPPTTMVPAADEVGQNVLVTKLVWVSLY